MITVCNKSNRRVYERCLKDFLNARRQLNGKPIYKTISKYKKLFNVETAREAYKVAEDLYETSTHKYAPFESIDEMGELLLNEYAGKRVKIIYLLPADEKNDRIIVRDHIYTIPTGMAAFANWWEGKIEWHWRTNSDNTIFDVYSHTGDVYVTEQINLTGNLITQSYLDNPTKNCIFAPIIKRCNEMITNNRESPAAIRMLKKVEKMFPQYVDGVKIDDLKKICENLQIKITLTLPLIDEIVEYGAGITKTGKERHNIFTVNYINTRLNHVEEGKYYDDGNPTYLPEVEFNELCEKMFDEYKTNWFLFRRDVHGINVIELKTLTQTYKRMTTLYNVINEFNYQNSINTYELDDIKEDLLSKFIRASAHMTCNRINPVYRDKLEKYLKIYKEIDGIKAYANYKKCHMYRGFVGKITDFRNCDRIEGLGLYLIGNLDWTNALPKIKQIQKIFSIYHGRNVYASPELEYLSNLGVTYKIYGGAWGMKIDMEFGTQDEMDEKCGMFEVVDGVPHYSRWTGIGISDKPFNTYYMKTDDLIYADIIKARSKIIVNYSNGELEFSTPNPRRRHRAHISSFIFAYQRINLIQQLLQMDVNKVLRINVDGIKYIPHDFHIRLDTFKYVEKPKDKGLTQNDRIDGMLTNINNCNPYDWFHFHLHFHHQTEHEPSELRTEYETLLLSGKRTHYETQLLTGKGGCGKTNSVITDKGLVRVLYIARTHILIQEKRREYHKMKLQVEVLANVIVDITTPKGMKKWKNIVENYNVLIFDEASMISEEERVIIFQMYKALKLIFCGDIGYQTPPINGTQMEMTAFQNVTQLLTNYRCPDGSPLAVILDMVREAIDTRIYNAERLISGLKTISIDELKQQYNITDIILSYTNNTKDKYTAMFADKIKYCMLQCTKDHAYNTGEIYYEKPAIKCKDEKEEQTYFVIKHGYTTHSVQGITFRQNIYIDRDILRNLQVLYTALSRAVSIDQIYIITDN